MIEAGAYGLTSSLIGRVNRLVYDNGLTDVPLPTMAGFLRGQGVGGQEAATTWAAVLDWLQSAGVKRRYKLLPLAGYVQATKSPLLLPPRYTYDANARRYRDAPTGRFVAWRLLLAQIASKDAYDADQMVRLSAALGRGDLTAAQWLAIMQQHLLYHAVQNALLGAGGWQGMTVRDYRRIDHAMQEDLDRLVRFGTQIQDGLLSAAQIRNRVLMYVGNARRQFFLSRPVPLLRPGMVMLQRRVLGVADHCDWCVYLADLGWQPYGFLPIPGDVAATWQGKRCLTACQCDLEERAMTAEEASQLLRNPLREALKAWRWLSGERGNECIHYN